MKKAPASTADKRKRKSTRYIGFIIRRLTPQQRYEKHIEGILLAIGEHDWHSVADHAMDIRELVAAHPELRKHEERSWSRRIKP